VTTSSHKSALHHLVTNAGVRKSRRLVVRLTAVTHRQPVIHTGQWALPKRSLRITGGTTVANRSRRRNAQRLLPP